ncbi:FYVE, RhoGEF and PH domain-containing protein 3 isoform X5 [Bos indicus x Bos taurus]|uniref:FYVE, RhoGEF and PH domain-containing protein 3 isoform X5 n=1 Tax=Bos indicus x Bos taurus TaxID=30522 RepID=UPI000F7D24E0|nr:FYVE, RhoGEF and PH domain-containing protein 3 isoform X5 [Bos indicus x Bos taurus]
MKQPQKPPASPSQRSENSALRMEPGRGSSTPSAPSATMEEPDAGPNNSSLEQPSTDPGKLPALPVGPGTHHGELASGSPGSQASAGDMSSVGEASSSKIPNRDSGIDSPSCSVVSEHFCEDSGEAGPGTIIKGPHPGTALGSKSPQEEADSDAGEGSSEEPDPENNPSKVDMDPAKCSEPQKLLHIAQELLHTEETYVKRLYLLDQVFCTGLTEAGIPSEVTTGIFSNISSIYRFHGQFLLPELQARITNEWDVNPRLGDILQKLAPFLKMYGEYVKNFDRAMELVSTWTQRSPVFKDTVQSIQKQELCGNLTLQHHMLEPVQRVPRYELLLKDYLKRLPEDAPDWKDAERSLELISTAANHSNAAIRKMEKMHKLLEVYERLGGEEDIVNPANELIKEGHIQKLSAKNGTTQDRHLFLVQDIVKSGAAHTFIITGKKRSLELQTRTEEEKKEWIQVIQATIEKHKQNSQTFKAFSGSFSQDENSPLTPEPPMMSPSSEVPAVPANSGGGVSGSEPRRGSSKTRRDKEKQGCSSCGETFNSITKRKHHCKLCGAVICGKCSEFKAENGRQSRVCKECFLTQPVAHLNLSLEEPLEPKQSTEKPVAAEPPPSLLCGPLQVSDGGTAWSKAWAAISESDSLELVLHLHEGSQQDGQLLHAIPLSGCRVSVLDPAERLDARHVWQLQQAQQSLYLSAPSAELQQQWLEALSSAAHRHSSQASLGAPQPQAPAAP